jgi:hypothetical protein
MHATFPERAGPTGRNRAGEFSIFELTSRALSLGHLSDPNRYVTEGLRSNGRTASSSSARAETHRRSAGKRAATARDVGEEELDGAGRKRVRRFSSSTSHRPFLQRRPDAVAPTASRSSPALLATTNEREQREERMSGRLLGMVCVRRRARRGFL